MRGLSQKNAALLVVALAFFTDMFLYYVLVPLLPEYARRLGLGQMGAGVLFGSYAVAVLAGTFPLGRLGDRVGRRLPMLWGLIGLGATTLLFTLTESFPLLLLARFLQGLSAAATWATGLAILADYFPAEERGRAMGTAFAFANLAVLISPLVSGFLAQGFGVKAPFYAAAVLALLDAAARAFLLHDPPRGEAPNVIPWRELFSNRSVMVLSGVMALGAAMWGLFESTLPLDFDRRLKATASEIGIVFAAAAGMHMLTSPVMGQLSDRIGRTKIIRTGLLAAPFLIPLPAILSDRVSLIASMLALGFLTSLVISPASPGLADAVEKTGSRSFGSAYSLLNVAYSVGMMAGPFVGSALASLIGLPASLIVVGIVFGLYSILLSRA
ncbi:MAG: MFS transporter [Acidobacteria bacterium]|nr:MFS transporter [Acidobacteriota bacterium]